MSDFQRIKSNVELMASKNAPPQDIDGYLATEGYTPEKFKSENSPSLGGTAVKYSAASGLANLADAIPNTLVNLANLGIAGYGVGKHVLTGSNDLPETISPDALSGWSKIGHETGLINDEYKPTTNAGRIVDFTTQAITGGGVRPGMVAKNLAAGMVKPVIRDVLAAAATGAAAGTAHAATHDINTGNQAVDNTIKAVAPLLAGMATGSIIASKGTGADRAAAAMQGLNNDKPIPWYKLDAGNNENVSPNIKLARALRALGDKEGTPVTDYEAIQAVTGINPKMQTQQRIAEQSDAAANTLTPMMQNRPKVNAALFKKIVDQITPEEARPDSVAGQVNKAAESAINNQRMAGNDQARPFYKSAEPTILSKAQESATVLDPAISYAIEHVVKDPFNSAYGMPKNTVGVIDAAKKHLDDIKGEAKNSGKNNLSSNAGSAAKNAAAIGDAAAPEYAIAREIVQKNMQENVEPMVNGQIGKLSETNAIEPIARAFLPRKPKDVNENVIAHTVEKLVAENPEIVKKLLGVDLRGDFNESNQGTNAMGASQFQKLISDNPQQKANLIQALKSSGVDPEGMTNMLDIFKAQGYKPSVNSATAANMDEAARLDGAISAVARPLQAIPKFVDQWRNSGASADLAKAMTTPYEGTGPMPIENLARMNGAYSPIQQQILISLLLANKAAREGQ